MSPGLRLLYYSKHSKSHNIDFFMLTWYILQFYVSTPRCHNKCLRTGEQTQKGLLVQNNNKYQHSKNIGDKLLSISATLFPSRWVAKRYGTTTVQEMNGTLILQTSPRGVGPPRTRLYLVSKLLFIYFIFCFSILSL